MIAKGQNLSSLQDKKPGFCVSLGRNEGRDATRFLAVVRGNEGIAATRFLAVFSYAQNCPLRI